MDARTGPSQSNDAVTEGGQNLVGGGIGRVASLGHAAPHRGSGGRDARRIASLYYCFKKVFERI